MVDEGKLLDKSFQSQPVGWVLFSLVPMRCFLPVSRREDEPGIKKQDKGKYLYFQINSEFVDLFFT